MRINTDNNCNIIITDDTVYPVNGIKYEDSVSIYLALLNESNKTTMLYYKMDNHQNSDGKPIKLEPLKGGYMTTCHIILPVEEVELPEAGEEHLEKSRYIVEPNDIDNILDGTDYPGNVGPESEISNDPHLKKVDYIINNRIDRMFTEEGEGNPDPIYTYYFSDGKDIYRRNYDLSADKVDLQELLEVNPTPFGLQIQILNFFSVCYLRKCYISLCQKIFNDRGFDRCFNGKVSSLSIFKRDLVWAALNTILYMIDSNQYPEAQRLLERINGCNGLCSKEETGEQRNCGCQ